MIKNLFFVTILILSINVCAQNELENPKVFVRVYDLEGKKIAKGKIISISDASLQLYRKGESVKVMVNGIGSIKTKRSPGNNVLSGAAIGAATGAIIGAVIAANDQNALLGADTPGEGAFVLGATGATYGALIGGITPIFKNSKSYEINGDMVKWKVFKEIIINKR